MTNSRKKINSKLTRVPDELKDDFELQLEKNLAPRGDRTHLLPKTTPTPTPLMVDQGIGSERYKVDAAEQIGRISDQVLTGSPGQETGLSGKYNMKKLIERSYHPGKDTGRDGQHKQ
ncbi:MAG: hypothetical protein UMV23_01980 [Halanaerobium sp.]|nr:hypothetical protein [Halanaerobium sp.]